MYSASEFTFAAPNFVYVYDSFPDNALVVLNKERPIDSCFVPDVFKCCTALFEDIMMSSVGILRRWTLGNRFWIIFCRNISLSQVREKKRWEKSYSLLMARQLKINEPASPKQR